ncbi:hypothetical protein [Deinococcus alpinitundrae]|uniref:hypothetical protein n=1 Tax=Deinococcus alpinitundrae TaxID=468913 RepID=UPI00137B6DBC|nr:hypothetical protein [Deinococcus alpinitundrae]
MIVETKVVGRRTPFERRATELPEGTDTLEQLLTCLVQDEVQRYQERQDQVGLLRVLTERELTHGTAQGKITTAPQERSSAPNLQTATATVLQAFPRSRPDRALLLEAHQPGWASEHDLLDTLIGPRERSEQFRDLSLYRTHPPRSPAHPSRVAEAGQ